LAFKPETDDMREAPSTKVIKGLVERGAKIIAYDPQAETEAKMHYLKGISEVTYATGKYDASKGVDALLLITEWKEFRSPDFEELKTNMKNPIIFDGRNQYNGFPLKDLGFEYYQIGKK
jgi:UDPglucose 6-dehydrogenase